MNQTVACEVTEHIRQEHDNLREKLKRIHVVLSERDVRSDEIAELLCEFHGALVVHFSNEEQTDGFFSAVTTHAPQLSTQAARLCTEHDALLHKTNELCRFAAAGSPSMTWWRELDARCRVFSQQLMQHESAESQLLQKAYLHALGGTGD